MADSHQPRDQPQPDSSGPANRRTRTNNPAWVHDELILALNLYLRQRGHIPSPRDADIVRLSDVLNQLPIRTVRPDLAKFRNPNRQSLDQPFPAHGAHERLTR